MSSQTTAQKHLERAKRLLNGQPGRETLGEMANTINDPQLSDKQRMLYLTEAMNQTLSGVEAYEEELNEVYKQTLESKQEIEVTRGIIEAQTERISAHDTDLYWHRWVIVALGIALILNMCAMFLAFAR